MFWFTDEQNGIKPTHTFICSSDIRNIKCITGCFHSLGPTCDKHTERNWHTHTLEKSKLLEVLGLMRVSCSRQKRDSNTWQLRLKIRSIPRRRPTHDAHLTTKAENKGKEKVKQHANARVQRDVSSPSSDQIKSFHFSLKDVRRNRKLFCPRGERRCVINWN